MARRTFEEKVKYNAENVSRSEFSAGYSWAVTLYRRYSKGSASEKRLINDIFNDAHTHYYKASEELKRADSDIAIYNAKQKVDYNKGMLCGMRDAAQARKFGSK